MKAAARSGGDYRLLALDIDGTLLRTDKTLSARTRSAVDAARARGVHLVLVTGRRYPSARRVAEELGGDVLDRIEVGDRILDVKVRGGGVDGA